MAASEAADALHRSSRNSGNNSIRRDNGQNGDGIVCQRRH